jgi:hypothetical protein
MTGHWPDGREDDDTPQNPKKPNFPNDGDGSDSQKVGAFFID